MDFKEYIEYVMNVVRTDKIGCSMEFHYFNLDKNHMKLDTVSDESAIIKIPFFAENEYRKNAEIVTVKKDAFRGKEYVTDIILPGFIGVIEAGAFAGCTGLKRITIPRKITLIEEGTFDRCTALEDVYYEGTMDEWRKMRIVQDEYEIESCEFIPGIPAQKGEGERMRHITGNDPILNANIHFRCQLVELYKDNPFTPLYNRMDEEIPRNGVEREVLRMLGKGDSITECEEMWVNAGLPKEGFREYLKKLQKWENENCGR